MFIGHYSAAFVARRVAPSVSLPAWFIACQLIDLCWGTLILCGVEKLRVIPHFTESNNLDLYFMPFTHSLSSAVVWSVAAATLFWACTPRMTQRTQTAVIVGLAVASHWLLDLLVHVPDLPLWYDSMKVGLGWWNYRTFALLLELALLWSSLLYCRQGVAHRGRYVALGVVMTGLQIFSLLHQPSDPMQVAQQLLMAYAFLTAAAWLVDRPRAVAMPARA